MILHLGTNVFARSSTTRSTLKRMSCLISQLRSVTRTSMASCTRMEHPLSRTATRTVITPRRAEGRIICTWVRDSTICITMGLTLWCRMGTIMWECHRTIRIGDRVITATWAARRTETVGNNMRRRRWAWMGNRCTISTEECRMDTVIQLCTGGMIWRFSTMNLVTDVLIWSEKDLKFISTTLLLVGGGRKRRWEKRYESGFLQVHVYW